MYKTLPTITELRPLDIVTRIFTDATYNDLGNAIKARLEIERDCKNENYDTNTIKSKTAKFDTLFIGYFPSDSECSY